MKIQTRVSVLLLTAVLFVGCLEVDPDYDLSNAKWGDVVIGNRIEAPLVYADIQIVDLVDFDAIKAANPGIGADSWDDFEGMSIRIPDITLPELEFEVDIDESIIETLTSEGELWLNITASSSLPFDLEITAIDFVYPGGRLDGFTETITVTGTDNGSTGQPSTSRHEITADLLRSISEATALEGTIHNTTTENMIFRKNTWLKFSIGIEKTGGIRIDMDTDNDE